MIGPFRITAKHGSSCVLDLPNTMSVHSTFGVNLLRKHPDNALPEQKNEVPPPIIIDGEEEWEVEDILESRKHRNQLQYRAKWVGYEDTRQWWPATDFQNASEKVREYHSKFPLAVKPRRMA